VADDALEKLSSQIPSAGDASPGPPLHLWKPELSGDIDIVIRRDGSWIHEGAPIRRQSLVRLFASILRREADGDYYLVTPVEKWRIRVEGLPLLVVDFDLEAAGTDRQTLRVTSNVGRVYAVGRHYPLFFPEDGEDAIPAVALDHGLAAQFNRAAWYRLVAAAEERDGVTGIASDGLFFPLQPV
jgi:hypothetical protein